MPKKRTKEEQFDSVLKEWGKMVDKYNDRIVKDLNRIARLEVWKWYKSYSPYEYTRQRTLYYAFKIVDKKNRMVSIRFGSSLMYPIHRVDQVDRDYIYENSFIRGFHGGAIDGPDHPNPGIPYWRTPKPDYPLWSYPAARSKSPYDRINEAFDKYEIRMRDKITNDFGRKLYPKLVKIVHS